MAEWLVISLLLVFTAHLVIFTRLALKRRLPYYWLISAVFAVLVTSFGLRLFAPDWMLGSFAGYQLFRYIAWLLAAITIPWMLIRILNRKR
jgi:hypothetical protein